MHGLSAEQLGILRQYDTPTICNVIEVFEVRGRHEGYMDARIKACYPQMEPLVGYAATATYRAQAPAREGDVYSALDEQVATFAQIPSPTIVVFQDLDEPTRGASFGEVMCTTYKTFGAVGLITSGAARDLAQVGRMGFPAFSDGAICSHGYGHIVDLMVPVAVGGVIVHPGDLLHGDCNGVVVVPNEIATEVAGLCGEYVVAEDVVLDYLQGDEVSVEGLKAARAESKRRITALIERVRAS